MLLPKSLFSGCFLVPSLPLEGNLTVLLMREDKFSVAWLSCASWHTHSPMSMCRTTANCSTLQTAPRIWHANNAAKISLLILDWPLNPEITSNNKEFIWERLDLQHGSVESLQVSCPLILQSTDTVALQDRLKLSLAMKGHITWQHINGRDKLPELAILWALRNVGFSCWKSLFPLEFTWTQRLGFGLILWKQQEDKHLRMVSPQTCSYQTLLVPELQGNSPRFRGHPWLFFHRSLCALPCGTAEGGTEQTCCSASCRTSTGWRWSWTPFPAPCLASLSSVLYWHAYNFLVLGVLYLVVPMTTKEAFAQPHTPLINLLSNYPLLKLSHPLFHQKYFFLISWKILK